MTFVLGDTELPLGGVTHVMGVINLSPESRNKHTIAETPDEAVRMADRYREWGATIIDVGGQSSHYENPTIAAQEEIARAVPAIEALVAAGHLVSIDTWKPEVAAAAVDAGAVLVNDTGGLSDPEMRKVVADRGVSSVVVYVEGANPHDVGAVEIREDKAERTAAWFRHRLDELTADGIENVILDPGIALNYRGNYRAYTRMQLEVIMDSTHLRKLGRPLLIPIPRKQELHRVVAYITLALEHEADIIRAHDVEVACDLVELFGRSAPLP
ncbi:MAG TPA: dihydropteroate synthase [Acidimicrobiia bacterium]